MKLQLKDPWKKIGNTRLIRISKNLYGKLETENPTGSIKDRPVQYIVRQSLERDEITKKTTLVEASSGNTGISLSAIGASLGLPVKIVMPSNMSPERKKMMKLFGAEIIDAPPSDFRGAIQIRNHLVESNDNYWSPMQFENNLNIECHYNETSQELLRQLKTLGETRNFDAFISGAGTGGTIMGFKKRFKEDGLKTQACLVVPEESLDTHGIQGIGDGEDFLVSRNQIDRVEKVRTQDAIKRARHFAKKFGVLVGISSGANLCAAERLVDTGLVRNFAVVILCDRGERYLSSI